MIHFMTVLYTRWCLIIASLKEFYLPLKIMKKIVKLLIVVTFDLHSFDDFFFMQKISKRNLKIPIITIFDFDTTDRHGHLTSNGILETKIDLPF